MKVGLHQAPHIKSTANNKTVMGDVILCLMALYFIAAYYYGARALTLAAVSVLVCCGCDVACVLLAKRPLNFRDFSPVVTGLLLPLLMPASIPYRVVVAAAVFAICVAKQPFGGLGSNLFNPAAAGLAFVTVCWPSEMFLYPAPFSQLELWGPVTARLSTGAAYTLHLGGVPAVDGNSVLLGLHPGPMGAANVLVITACLIFLAVRHTVRFAQPFFFCLAGAIFAFCFPRIDAGRGWSVFYELLTTSFLFYAVFVFTDPVTSPKRTLAKACFGFASGILVMLFDRVGAFEITLPFAVLLMNALAPVFDWFAEWMAAKERRTMYARAIEQQDDFSDGEQATQEA